MRILGRARARHRPLLIGLLACTLIASSGIASADPAAPSETPPDHNGIGPASGQHEASADQH